MNKRAGNLMNGARENYWKKKDAEIAEEYLKKVYKRMSIFFSKSEYFPDFEADNRAGGAKKCYC